MSKRIFKMRSQSQYQGQQNIVSNLNVELLHENSWEPFDLNIETAGFLIFVYAVFTCQHLYMRTNAAENNIVLDKANGTITVITGEDWNLESIQVLFECTIFSGTPGQDTIDYIISRMKACPVSLNIRRDLEIDARLTMKTVG